MSELHESGQHPDADQLNAFLEHALPPHEREQTLAHLAGCPACRTVLALSLPPTAEAAHPKPAPARRPWFLGWNLVWPVAAAFAALVPLVLYIHRTETAQKNAAAPSEIAESRPSQPPLAPPASAPPLADKAASPHAPMEKPASAPAAAAPLFAKRPEPGAPTPAPIAFAQISSAAAVGAAAAPANPAAAPQPPAASAGGARSAAPDQGNGGIYGGTGQVILNSNYVEGVPAPSAPAPPPPAAASADASMHVASATDAIQLNAADAISEQSQLQALPLHASLPSGLPALSTASRGRLALALDTANTLFLSDDGGHRWSPVPANWKGRAVSVRLAAAPVALARATAKTAGAGLGGFAAGALAATPRQDSGGNSGGTSGIAGIVTDPTGAAIRDAAVAVIDAAGQTIRNTQSGPDGHYRIDGLAPGGYQVQARAPGFQWLDTPIRLTASQQTLDNLTLQVGVAAETVTVTGAPAFEPDESARDQSKKKAALDGPLQPTPLFEITTESGERWISSDGQTWMRRP